MKNYEILNLHESLNRKVTVNGKQESFFNNLRGEKFLYALNKNRNLINSYIVEIRNKNKFKDQFKYSEYTGKVRELNNKYSNLMKDVRNKINDENKKEKPDEEALKKLNAEYDDYKNKTEIEIKPKLEELKVEYADVIKSYEEYLTGIENFQNEESTCQVYKLKREHVPEDITDEQYQLISLILED